MTEKRRQRTERKRIYLRGLFAVCLLLFSVIAFQYEAKADVYLMADSGERLFVGETLILSDYFQKDVLEQILPESLQYTVSDTSESKDCIELTSDGRVTALAEGNAVISIAYQLAEGNIERVESFYVTVIPPETITAAYGEVIWLAAFDMYNPYARFDVWEEEDIDFEKYSYSFSNDSVVLEDGRDGLLVQGFKNADVYLEKASKKILVAEITVKVPKFKQERMARATNTTAFYPELENCTFDSYSDYEENVIYLTEPVWGVENQKIVEFSESGFVAAAIGSTKITAAFTARNGDTLTLSLPVSVTDPKLKKDMVVVAAGVTKKAPVSGTCSDSRYWSEKNPSANYDVPEFVDNVDEVYNDITGEFLYSYLTETGSFGGLKEGTEEVVFIVDGRELTITIIVTNPRYGDNTFTMYKGLKKTVPVLGLDKQYSTISYTSGNTNAATVTKAGKVTAKKVGTTKIKVKADGKTFNIWVEIASKKAYQAAKKEIAISKTKTKYSQAKRMSKGYYDCSSLVSRVYRKYGVYFGSKTGWSPTAAGIGQWCSNHNKVIAKKAVDYTKLVPGDLVFYSYTKNGRYKNISHVEMYVGNGMSVSASSSHNAVIHYGYSTYGIVLIARPTK